MAKIVGGFWVPHDPVMFVAPDAPADKDVAARMWQAYETCGQKMAELDATAAIIVGNDHYILFGTNCLPRYLIGTGDVDGPIENLSGLERGVIKNHEALAQHIVKQGDQENFDWSVARSFTVDHAFSIPHQYVVEVAEKALNRTIPTIPIYIASGVDPFISLKRSRELGEHILRAVESFPEDERVVIIGSGGISHWVGTVEMGKVAEDFDQEILDLGVNGDLEGLSRYSNEEILERGGNGAMEIRNLLCALAAVPNRKGEIIDYAPVPEWVTGLGFLQIHADQVGGE